MSSESVAPSWWFESLLWGIPSRFPLASHFDLSCSESILGIFQYPPMCAYSFFSQDGFWRRGLWAVDITYFQVMHPPFLTSKEPFCTWVVREVYLTCCSITPSCLTLCDTIDHSMPGFPILHRLPELPQTHVHCVSDAIQSSHPLSSPSPPPFIFPSIRVFSNELALCIRWPKYWSFSLSISPSNEYSGLISFWISLQSKGLSRIFSSTTL